VEFNPRIAHNDESNASERRTYWSIWLASYHPVEFGSFKNEELAARSQDAALDGH